MELTTCVLACVTFLSLVTPIYTATTYAYFSDVSNCDQLFTVGRDDRVEVEGKRPSDSASTGFSNCHMQFRAQNLDDTLCMKIQTMTFSSNNLEWRYFASLDPTVGTPTLTYSNANGASTPEEICSNEREISMKLHILSGTPTVSEIAVKLIIYTMEGNQRIGYMDEDCGIVYKITEGIVTVRNTNSAGAMQKVDTCQLYFEYDGTNVNKTVCSTYTEVVNNCNYNLKVFKGKPATGTVLVNTYDCNNETPQTICSDKNDALFLELANTGSSALPDGVFTVTVAEGDKEVSGAASSVSGHCYTLLNMVVLGAINILVKQWLQ